MDGIKIVGFQVENVKGVRKNFSYDKTAHLVMIKKIDGVSYRKVNETPIFVGLDFKNIDKIPIREVTNYEIKDSKLYIKEDKEDVISLSELTDIEFWNLCQDGAVRDDRVKIGLLEEDGVYKKVIHIEE